MIFPIQSKTSKIYDQTTIDQCTSIDRYSRIGALQSSCIIYDDIDDVLGIRTTGIGR